MSQAGRKSLETSEEIDLFLVIKLVFMNWWMVLGAAVCGMVLAWGVSYFFITPNYRSTAVILPGNEGGGMGGSLRSVLSSSPIGALIGASGGSENIAKYVELLESRAMAAQIVEELNKDSSPSLLSGEALAKKRDSEIEDIRSATKVEPLPSGIIKIQFRNESAEYAKKIVDLHLRHLQSMIGSTLQTQAKATELFVKDRLKESQEKLTEVETRYIALQKDRGVIQLPSQLGMSLNTASQFRGQLIQKEMEIELYKNIMRDSSEVKRLEAERDQIQNQLNKIVDGPKKTANSKKGRNNVEVFTPLSEGPGLEMEFAAAEREYLIQSKLVELLRHQLELALIETKKQEPSFLVIDPPIVAVSPYSPNMKINTVLGAFVAAFFCVIWVLMVNQVAFLQQRFRGIVKTTRPQLTVLQ